MPPQWRPYSELKRELQRLVPTNYKEECKCRQPDMSEEDLAVKEDGVGSTIVAGGGDEAKGKSE